MTESPWAKLRVPPARIIGAGLSVQVVGQLNPLIFQPAWFERYQLISPAESEEATQGSAAMVLAPGVCRWSTSALEVEVGTETFSILTMDETREEALSDITIGAFEQLHHTPVSRVEFERFVHLDVENDEQSPSGASGSIHETPTDRVKAKLRGLLDATFWSPLMDSATVDSVAMTLPSSDGASISIAVQPSAISGDALFAAVSYSISVEHADAGAGAAGEGPTRPTTGAELAATLKTRARVAEDRTRHEAASLLRQLLNL